MTESFVQMLLVRTDWGTGAAVRKAPRHWLTSAPWARTTPGSHAQAPPISRCARSAWCLTAAASLLQVLSEPWRLSTSQSAQFQIGMFDPKKYPNHLGAGGGFGPVSALAGCWVGRTGAGVSVESAGTQEVRPEVGTQPGACPTWKQNGNYRPADRCLGPAPTTGAHPCPGLASL